MSGLLHCLTTLCRCGFDIHEPISILFWQKFYWRSITCEKMRFLCFALVQKHYRRGGKIKHLLISYFLTNVSAKNDQNRFMHVNVIARWSSDIFETQCSKDIWGRVLGRRWETNRRKLNHFQLYAHYNAIDGCGQLKLYIINSGRYYILGWSWGQTWDCSLQILGSLTSIETPLRLYNMF